MKKSTKQQKKTTKTKKSSTEKNQKKHKKKQLTKKVAEERNAKKHAIEAATPHPDLQRWIPQHPDEIGRSWLGANGFTNAQIARVEALVKEHQELQQKQQQQLDEQKKKKQDDAAEGEGAEAPEKVIGINLPNKHAKAILDEIRGLEGGIAAE